MKAIVLIPLAVSGGILFISGIVAQTERPGLRSRLGQRQPPMAPRPKLNPLSVYPPIVLELAVEHPTEMRGDSVEATLDVVFLPDRRLTKELNLDLEGSKVTLQLVRRAEVRVDNLTANLIKADTGRAPRNPVLGNRYRGTFKLSRTDLEFISSREAMFRGVTEKTHVFHQRQDLGILKPTLPEPIRLKGGIMRRLIPLFTQAAQINNSDRTLIIRHPNVVNDPARTFDPCTNTGTPMGKWTFGFLMSQMAPPTGNPSDFVEAWLSSWKVLQIAGNDTIPAVPNRVTSALNAWPRIAGRLDLAKAPFKLMAITNRMDLGGSSAYGGATSAGEGRFVFALMDSNCNTEPFLVILEYGIPKKGCGAIKNYAKDWIALDSLDFTDTAQLPNYLAKLEAITDVFSLVNADPTKKNGSAINQVRTNEVAAQLAQGNGGNWEFREFRLSNAGALVNDVLVKNPHHMTPPATEDDNNTAALGTWINANAAAVLSGNYSLPPSLQGAVSRYPTSNFWDAPAIAASGSMTASDVRNAFSKQTCDSCHAREFNTQFVHISWQSGPSGAFLSPFLSGSLTVNDPVTTLPRTIDEIAARKQAIGNLANRPCFMTVLLHRPLLFTH